MSELEVVPGSAVIGVPESAIGARVAPRYGAEPLLRRMLATADVLAVVLAAVAVGLWGNRLAMALLLVLGAPLWIVTAKLVGLYDRDQRTLRHLTVDEVPWLAVWALSSTAVLT